METRWRSHENTWAGGERINRALRDQDAVLLRHLLEQNPGLLVRPVHLETRERSYQEWKPVEQATVAHAVVGMGWMEGLDALHAAGEAFTRQPSTGKRSPLALAVHRGEYAMVEKMLHWGAPATGQHLRPLVMDAVEGGNSHTQVQQMVDLLARHGARADVRCVPPQGNHQAPREEMPLWSYLLRDHHALGLAQLLAHARDEDKQWLGHEKLWFDWRFGCCAFLFRSSTHFPTPAEHLRHFFLVQDILEAHGAIPMRPDYVAELGAHLKLGTGMHHAEAFALMVRSHVRHTRPTAAGLGRIEQAVAKLLVNLERHNPVHALHRELSEQLLQSNSVASHTEVPRPRL